MESNTNNVNTKYQNRICRINALVGCLLRWFVGKNDEPMECIELVYAFNRQENTTISQWLLWFRVVSGKWWMRQFFVIDFFFFDNNDICWSQVQCGWEKKNHFFDTLSLSHFLYPLSQSCELVGFAMGTKHETWIIILYILDCSIIIFDMIDGYFHIGKRTESKQKNNVYRKM